MNGQPNGSIAHRSVNVADPGSWERAAPRLIGATVTAVDLREASSHHPGCSAPLRIAEIASVWLPVPPPAYGGIERVVVVAPLLRSEDEVLEQPPEAVKLDVLARAHATLFPIDWPEPFWLVMAESMACGTPVIARPVGAAPEVVEHGVTGFLCDTVEAMAAAVDHAGALSPAACRDRAERRFSGAAMAAGYEPIFDRVGVRTSATHANGDAART